MQPVQRLAHGYHIYQGGLALFHDVLSGTLDSRGEIFGLLDGPFGVDTQSASHGCEVDIRAVDIAPNYGISDRALRVVGNLKLVNIVVVVGAVVVVGCSSPHTGDEEQVAVGMEVDVETPRLSVGKGHAHRADVGVAEAGVRGEGLVGHEELRC